ncbi:hypothetical protein T484DRAFT_1749727 [Baffinella frigidus]|nr:hypothetical protein T484DRAFT_1749727 [Cryptophyta sp. CCMP2293]
MPLRLNIRRKLTSRSDRVKCVDLHPDEPWMLCSLYNGTVHLWNYQSQTLLKTFEVIPRRCFTPTPSGTWATRTGPASPAGPGRFQPGLQRGAAVVADPQN